MASFQHAQLGAIRGVRTGPLLQFFSLPYATVQQRFARSTLLDSLPDRGAGQPYDATTLGPESIQPLDAAKTDARSNQLPDDIIREERSQSEDCTRLSITAPEEHLKQDSKLPVVWTMPCRFYRTKQPQGECWPRCSRLIGECR